MNKWRQTVPFVLWMITAVALPGISQTENQFDGPFKPTAESLKQYECPEWFRDAKFGIYMHWGPQSVPGVDSWYARTMYKQGSGAYRYHVKHFGHPSDVGFRGVIKAWKAEKINPDQLVSLVKQAGARYFTPVAVHHDNFDLWDSKHHKWNATNYGPKKDIIGMLREATLDHGLRWGVTTHLARSYSWFQTSHGSDRKGSKKGVPYDGNDPKYRELYHEESKDRNAGHPKNAPKHWRNEWKKRLKDLVHNYKPDLLYFDSAIPFLGEDRGRTGMELIAYYYNQNMKWNDGNLEAVMNTKEYKNNDHGLELDGATTIDFERGRSNSIRQRPWQTDASVGPWYWQRNPQYRSTERIVHELVDIVSKNGNLLLNVPPKPNGKLEPAVVNILKNIGRWLDVNGKAIYGTRPWEVYGEGPVVQQKSNLNKHAEVPDVSYSHRDIRYTRSKDGSVLYAIILGWPEQSKRKLTSVRVQDVHGNAQVTLLGHDKPLEYNITDTGRLNISVPSLSTDERPTKYAYAFKITGFDLEAVRTVAELTPSDAKLSGPDLRVQDTAGGTNIGYWDDPTASVHWLVEVPEAGRYRISGQFAAASGASKLKLVLEGKQVGTFEIPQSKEWSDIQTVSQEGIQFEEPGVYHLSLQPVSAKQWQPVNVHGLQLLRSGHR